MRGRALLSVFLLSAVMALSSCVTTINSAADELRMYRWCGNSENGTVVSLSFEAENALFEVENTDDVLRLYGFCVLTDDKIVICDEASKMNYTFAYQLYGNRVELSYNNHVLSLEKEKDSE